MQGDKKVIAHLNQLLANELTSIDQYFLHSRMLQNWGLQKLYQRINHEMSDEQGHAAALIERILFLDGMPDVAKREALNIGHNVPDMFKHDLKLEIGVAASLKVAIAYCEHAADYQTRQILLGMLKDTEEDHAYWLEQQLGLIEKIGLPNYLQSQL